ncbi:MAG: hypothetical protein ACYDBQ_02175 [Thermoplasmatota archaeon]
MRPSSPFILALATAILLAGLTPQVARAATVDSNGNVTEDFENCPIAGQPSDSHYTFRHTSGTNVFCDSSQLTAPGGVNGQVEYALGGSMAVFTLQTNICDINMWGEDTSAPGSNTGGVPDIWIGNKGADQGLGQSAGDEYILLEDSPYNAHNLLFGGKSATMGAGAYEGFNTNNGWAGGGLQTTWYHYDLNFCTTAPCGNSSCTVGIVTVYPDGSGHQVFQVSRTFSSVYGATHNVVSIGGCNTGPCYIDNVKFGQAPVIANIGQAAAAVPVNNLVGFDVDPTGSTVIARYNPGASGSTVGVYTAGGLVPGPTIQSNCNRVDGVGALANFVTYADCQNSPAYVSEMVVDTSQMTAPNFGPNSNCAQYANQLGINVPAQMQELGRVSLASWDGSAQYHPALFGSGQCVFAWTYETVNGVIGLYAVDFRVVTTSSDTEYTLDPSASSPNVAQICSWHDYLPKTESADPSDFLAGVSENGPVTVQRIGVTVDPNDNTPIQTSLGTWFTPSGAFFGGASAVGCANHHVLMATPTGTIGLMRVDGGTSTKGAVLWTRTGIGVVPTRGATLSPDGSCPFPNAAQCPGWYAYVAGTVIHIGNATSGQEVTTIPEPTCNNLVEMKMDAQGQSLWLACSNEIYRFAIYTATTKQPVSNNPNLAPTPTPSVGQPGGPAAGGMGVFVDAFSSLLGGAFDAGTTQFLTGLVIILLATGGFLYLGRNSNHTHWFVTLGATLGYVAAMYIANFPTWPIVAVLVIAVAFIFIKARGTKT